MANEAPVTVIETEQFAAAARKARLPEGEIFAIIDYLSRNPEAGDLIRAARASARFGSRGRAEANAAAIG